MTLVDVNILLYAEDSSCPHHATVRPWWDALLNNAEVGFCWHTLNGFLRIATHPKLTASPLTPDEACAKVSGWLALPTAVQVVPGVAHWTVLEKLIRDSSANGNLLMDAHLAALALENDAELASCDSDFGRFSGLRWINPLSP